MNSSNDFGKLGGEARVSNQTWGGSALRMPAYGSWEPRVFYSRIIFVTSPLTVGQHNGQVKLAGELAYAQEAAKHVIASGFTPFVPHLHFNTFLDPENPDEFDLATRLSLDMLNVAQEFWAFVDHGLTTYMEEQIERAAERGIAVRFIRLIVNEGQTASSEFIRDTLTPEAERGDATLTDPVVDRTQ